MASISQITDAILPALGSNRLRDIQSKLNCINVVELTIEPRPHALVNECHTNVLRQVKWYGGESIQGYYIAVSENENKWVAIKHSIWKKDKELIDVTPVTDNRTKNVFVWGNKDLSPSVYYDGNKLNYEENPTTPMPNNLS